jgi:hypothetical protein
MGTTGSWASQHGRAIIEHRFVTPLWIQATVAAAQTQQIAYGGRVVLVGAACFVIQTSLMSVWRSWQPWRYWLA